MVNRQYRYKELNNRTMTPNNFIPMSLNIRYIFSIIVLFYLLIIGILNLTQWNTSLSFVYLSFISYIIVLMIPILFYRKRWGWFHPLVFLCIWTFFRDVVPASSLYVNGLEYHRALPGYSKPALNYLVAYGLLLQTISLVMIYFGFKIAPRISLPVIKWKKPKYIKLKLIIVASISTLALLILARVSGGIGNLLLQRGIPSDMRVAAQIGGGHWNVLVKMLIPACLVAFSLKKSLIYHPLFLILFLYSLFLEFAESGSRSGVIVPLILFLIIWSIQQKKIPYTRFLAIGIISVILLGSLGSLRDMSRNISSIDELQFSSAPLESLRSGVSTLTEYSGETKGLYPIIAKSADDVKLLYGESYLAILAAPIPSAIWPSKPEAGGKMTSTVFFGNPLSGVPPGGVGEAYWNFHIPGVIIVFFLWGMILKYISRFYVKNTKEFGVVSLYIITIMMLAPHGTAYYNWFHTFIPALLFMFICCGLPKVSFNSEK